MNLDKITPLFDGLQWEYSNENDDTLSVVCHTLSCGGEKGLFEVMPSWKQPNGKYVVGDVVGWLTFGEVQEWLNKLGNRGV